jgi:hypothetical protein
MVSWAIYGNERRMGPGPIGLGGVGSVLLDAAGTAALQTAAATVSYNGTFTVGGSATGLVVSIMLQANVAVLGTITMSWNGTSMTQLTAPISQGGNTASATVVLFGLRSPAPGSNTLTVSWSGGGSVQVMWAPVSVIGSSIASDAAAFPTGGARPTSEFAASPLVLAPTGAGATTAVVAAWGSNSNQPSSPSGTTLYNPGGPSINFGAGNFEVGATSIQISMASSVAAAGAAILVSP